MLVDAHGHAHEHVLGPLHHPVVDAQQVGPLQRLRARRGAAHVLLRSEGGAVLCQCGDSAEVACRPGGWAGRGCGSEAVPGTARCAGCWVWAASGMPGPVWGRGSTFAGSGCLHGAVEGAVGGIWCSWTALGSQQLVLGCKPGGCQAQGQLC